MEFKCKIDCLENHLRFSKQSILKLIFLSHKPSPIHLDQLSGGIRLISSMFKEMSCLFHLQSISSPSLSK